MKVPVSLTIGSVVNSTEEMKVAYSYTRFSTKEQRKGASKSRQVEKAAEWCKKFGYTLSTESFSDEGKSGFKGQHLQDGGELKRFLRLVEEGKIRPGSVLVMESMDRLSRLQVVEAVTLFLNVINAGIGIVFTMTYDQKLLDRKTINENQYLLFAVIGEAQRAYSESKHKSERVLDARKRRTHNAILTGKPLRVWCPVWCEFKNEKYVPIPERVEIVKRIFKEYLHGNGAFRISLLFNREKVPTLGKTDTWYKKIIRDILKDRRVYGFAHHLEKENYYPEIISKETFNRVQNRLTVQSEVPPTGGKIENVGNLFTTILRCAHCGGVMAKSITNKKYKNHSTRYEYLVCENARQGNNCSYRSILLKTFEQTFLAIISTTEFMNLLDGADETLKLQQNQIESLQGEQVTIQKQIAKFTELIINDDNPSPTLVKKLKEYEDKNSELSKRIRSGQAKLSINHPPTQQNEEPLENIFSQTTSPEGRLRLRDYIRSTVENIVIDTQADPINYTIRFKNGQVGSVVYWTESRHDHRIGEFFQFSPGVVKEINFNDDVVTITEAEKDKKPKENGFWLNHPQFKHTIGHIRLPQKGLK